MQAQTLSAIPPAGAGVAILTQIAADLTVLTNRWGPLMPDGVSLNPAGGEPFDPQDLEQCRRALHHLMDLARQAPLVHIVEKLSETHDGIGSPVGVLSERAAELSHSMVSK